MLTLSELLNKAIEDSASDLHLIPGQRPLYRVHTRLVRAEQCPVLTPQDTENFAKEMMGEDRFAQFLDQRDMDLSTQICEKARFRVNTHFQRDVIAISLRAIPTEVPRLEQLNLPPIVESFAEMPRGLVLVTGQTGHGKSTTLAAMIESVNHKFDKHIITLEDPIEYQLVSDKSVIEQREVGGDVTSFANGLRHALRQDPDVIMVGEMRDLETTSAAITAAETGHLVLSTMHTQSAAQTVERILDIYPAQQQGQIRAMLSNSLQAVVSMTLFSRMDAKGMIPACEIMVCNAAVSNCIRTDRVHEIANIIQTGAALGMCTLDDSIKSLCLSGKISRQQALAQAVRPERMSAALG